MSRSTIAALLAAILLSAPAQAQEVTADMLCPLMGDLAESVMENRQVGVALSRQMGILAGFSDQPVELQDVIRDMILGAYGVPRYTTDAYQRRAVQDYRSDNEAACYRGMGG